MGRRIPYNRVRDRTATTGAVLPYTVAGVAPSSLYFTIASKVANGAKIRYVVTDGTDEETCEGTWTLATTTLTRTVLGSTNGGAAVNWGVGNKTIIVGPQAADDDIPDFATGAAIASAATIDLDAMTGGRAHLTGTTTVTAVTISGGPRTLIHDGILTLTHHATNCNLPGAANIITAAGDRSMWEGDGTTAYCTDYIRASDAVVTRTATQTVTGKTLTSPVINGFSGTGNGSMSSNNAFEPQLNLYGASATAGAGPYVILNRRRGTVASPLVIQNGDTTGNFFMAGYDGAADVVTAGITGIVEGAVSSGNVPQALSFIAGITGATEQMRLSSVGLLTLNGGQIKFPAVQNPSSNANTLDDYEEGTWTPVLSAQAGTITSQTASGSYVKVGRLLFLNLTATVTNNGTGATGGIISGLPFSTDAIIGSSYRERGVGGNLCSIGPNTATSVASYRYDGAYPWSTGAIIDMSFCCLASA